MSDFITTLSEKLGEGISKKATKKIVDSFLEVMTEKLKTEGRVSFSGVFSLQIKDSAPTIKTNPRTKEKYSVPAKKRISARFSKGLKASIQ